MKKFRLAASVALAALLALAIAPASAAGPRMDDNGRVVVGG